MNYRCLITILITTLYACTSNVQTSANITASNKDSIIVRPDFKKYFDSCKVEGSIVIYDNEKKQWILSDTVGSKKETLPASTFKVINLLIALETKTIKDENELVQWPGSTDTVKYGYRPEIYHSMTVKKAFELSAGWVFVELAKKIGKKKYGEYLKLSQYGNGNLSINDADFWNFGGFSISPIDQVKFLKNLYNGNLPFSPRNMDIVKRVMLSEQHKTYTIHSKTGWTREGGINTGWWVGYLKDSTNTYFFATRLLQDRKFNTPTFAGCRKDITKSVFRELGIMH